MAIDNVSGLPVRQYTNGVRVEEPTEKDVSQTDFLRLMTTQLQNQDPFNPTDGQQMIVQMAQISTSAGIAEMGETLKDISEQMKLHTSLLEQLRPQPGETSGAASEDPANLI